MHTVERLEQAIALAIERGFTVRQDWFAGAAAGMCELKGRRYIFLDLALSPNDQLEQVLEALASVQAEEASNHSEESSIRRAA